MLRELHVTVTVTRRSPRPPPHRARPARRPLRELHVTVTVTTRSPIGRHADGRQAVGVRRGTKSGSPTSLTRCGSGSPQNILDRAVVRGEGRFHLPVDDL